MTTQSFAHAPVWVHPDPKTPTVTATRERLTFMPTLRLLPDLEDALRQIPGVRAVSVVTDPKANPTEIHVLASPGKPAKQVVRDVQSVALTRYDIDLDHRIVSVVQIGEDDGARDDAGDTGMDEVAGANGTSQGAMSLGPATATTPVPELPDDEPEPSRPAIQTLTVRTSGAEAQAAVTLVFADHSFEGVASGSAASSYRHRLVALAMLDALGPLLGLPTEVESATLVDTGVHTVALTVLVVNVPRLGPQSISGSAVVRGDEADAVARSVLDALNRRITG